MKKETFLDLIADAAMRRITLLIGSTDLEKSEAVRGVIREALACGGAMSEGIVLIAEERDAHEIREGWTAAHDDAHTFGEMADAAACYALTNKGPYRSEDHEPDTCPHRPVRFRVPFRWPWASKWWKPTPNDRVRELVKAGSLISAEIDRLLRAQRKGGQQ
jgi:hypothetical protein